MATTARGQLVASTALFISSMKSSARPGLSGTASERSYMPTIASRNRANEEPWVIQPMGFGPSLAAVEPPGQVVGGPSTDLHLFRLTLMTAVFEMNALD
jgi:hypothetical protein